MKHYKRTIATIRFLTDCVSFPIMVATYTVGVVCYLQYVIEAVPLRP